MKSNKFWFFIFGGVVLACVVLMLQSLRAPANYALIYKDGVLTETVNIAAITEPRSILVERGNYDTASKGYNYLEAERGRIRMSVADCPDGICMRQGWVSSPATPIVCLPNRVVVTLEGGDADVDAVAG